jgi:hypothetical protein
VGLLPEETGEAEVAGHCPEPADVVVAGDDHVRGGLAKASKYARARLNSLLEHRCVRSPETAIASGSTVTTNSLRAVQAFGDGGPSEVQIGDVEPG